MYNLKKVHVVQWIFRIINTLHIHEQKFFQDFADTEESEESFCTECRINRLLDENLVQIFSLLSLVNRIRIERVCKKWRQLARNSWSRQRIVSFHNIFKGFMKGIFARTLNSLPCFMHFNMSNILICYWRYLRSDFILQSDLLTLPIII